MTRKSAKKTDRKSNERLAFLFRPVDIASLVFFRIAFACVMLYEVVKQFLDDNIAYYWIEPDFHFKYYGFGWIEPLAGNGMYVVWGALGVLALLVLVGAWYRAAAALFFLGWTYVFFCEQARYLNHGYLICLVSFLIIFLPLHREFSAPCW